MTDSFYLQNEGILTKYAHANIDFYWGPWTSVNNDQDNTSAFTNIPVGKRIKGLKFGVANATTGDIEEYMFTKDNATDNDVVKLVLSSDDVTGTFDYTIGSTTSEKLSEAIGANKIITIGTYIASVGRVGTSSSGYYVVCYTDEDGVFHKIVHGTSTSSVGTETTKEFAEVETVNSTSELGLSGVIGGIKKYQGNTMLDLGGVSGSGTLGNVIKNLISQGTHIDADDTNNVFAIKNINNETIGSIALSTAANGAAKLTFTDGSNNTFEAVLPNLTFDSQRQMLQYVDAGNQNHDLIRLSNLQIKGVDNELPYWDSVDQASTESKAESGAPHCALGDLFLLEKEVPNSDPTEYTYTLHVCKEVQDDGTWYTYLWQPLGSINNVSLVADQVGFDNSTNGFNATHVQGAIEEVNEKVEKVLGNVIIGITDFTPNSYWNINREYGIGDTYNGSLIGTESNHWRTPERITLQAGDIITIRAKGSSASARAWVICDTDNKIINTSSLPDDTLTNPFVYTALAECYVYVNSIIEDGSVKVEKSNDRISNVESSLSALEDSVEANTSSIAELSRKLSNFEGTYTEVQPSNTEQGALAINGTVDSSATNYTTYTFNVQPGKLYFIHTQIPENGSSHRSFLSTYGANGFIERLESSAQKVMDKYFVFDDDVTSIKTYKHNSYDTYCRLIESGVKYDIEELKKSIAEINVETNKIDAIDERVSAIEGETTEITAASTDSNSVLDGNGGLVETTGAFTVTTFNVTPGELYLVHTQIAAAPSNPNTRSFLSTYHDNDFIETLVHPSEDLLEMNKYFVFKEGVNKIKTYKANRYTTSCLRIDSGAQYEIEKLKAEIESANSAIDELNGRITLSTTPKISNPVIDIATKSQLRVLDIGNSFTWDSVQYVNDFIQAANVDVSNMCFYVMTRGGGSFKSFYDFWLNQDTSHYGVVKRFGGINQTITGDSEDYLTRVQSAIKDCQWDIIIIHQRSFYDDYEQWEGDGIDGYLKEFIRILKTYQPNAMIGYLMSHCSYQQATNGNTQASWENSVKCVQFLNSNYGIDFVIPVATAIENLRASSTLNVSPVQYGFSRDKQHLGLGLARYVAAATYFQSLICRRYGGTVYGNTLTHEVTQAEIEANEATYPDECVDVTNANKGLAQICALNACSNMFEIIAPEGIANEL